MTATPPDVSALIERVGDDLPVHRRFLEVAVANATLEELSRLAAYLGFCQLNGLDIAYLARSYLTIVEDTIEEQLYFSRNNCYRHSTFAEVADHVYYDREYMDRYMYGLAIPRPFCGQTMWRWPGSSVRHCRKHAARADLEVGPGHGFLFLTAMELGSFDHALAIDLSAARASRRPISGRALLSASSGEVRAARLPRCC